MQMEVPLYAAGRQTGCARIWDEGLYRVVEAELPQCAPLLRLWLSFGGQIVLAGVFIPERTVLRCRRRFSRRSLPPGNPDHAVACWDGMWQPDGTCQWRWLPEGWELAEPFISGEPLRLCCAVGRMGVQTIEGTRCLVYAGEYPVMRILNKRG